MRDPGALNSALRSKSTSSLRSPPRCWKQCERTHPYRREARTPQALNSNGSSNGTTATLSKDTVETRETNAQSALMVDLMEQVATGTINPQMAAKYVQQIMSTSHVMREIKVEDKNWGQENLPAEIVWGPGKSASQLVIALQRVVQTGCAAIAVRVSPKMAEEVKNLLPEVKHNKVAGVLSISPATSKSLARLPGTVAIVSDASASDGVIQEIVTSLQVQGCYAYKLAGSGGPNSLPNLSGLPYLQGQATLLIGILDIGFCAAADSASVVIVAADGQGPLASVVASSIMPPVVVVPTNEAIVTNTPGLTHVDHNNGLAAALIAARILRTMARMQTPRKN